MVASKASAASDSAAAAATTTQTMRSLRRRSSTRDDSPEVQRCAPFEKSAHLTCRPPNGWSEEAKVQEPIGFDPEGLAWRPFLPEVRAPAKSDGGGGDWHWCTAVVGNDFDRNGRTQQASLGGLILDEARLDR